MLRLVLQVIPPLRRTLAAGTVTAAVVSLLAGCSTPSADVALPRKNQAAWVLPLDQYVAPTVDRSQLAVQILAQDCLRTAGYTWRVSMDQLAARPGESWNAANRKLFNGALAEKYGYGNSDRTDLSSAARQRVLDDDAANRTLADAAPEAVDRCMNQAQKRLGQTQKSSYLLAEELAVAASEDSANDSTVRAAARRWRTCMASAGVPDLPSTPEDMPPRSISSLRPAVDEVTPVGAETDVPAEERRVAVADAACQESSGWAKASYDAEWAAEADAMRKHADELERNAAAAESTERRAENIIASHAPQSE